MRSALFTASFYALTALCCILYLPLLLVPRTLMLRFVRLWLRGVAWLERHVLGLHYRVEGLENLPAGACIVAAKHQSAWETLKLHLLLRDPAVVLKRELLMLPLFGWYLTKAGNIPVDRKAGANALRGMLKAAESAVAAGRPVALFPQGTRLAPGARAPYQRAGTAALYDRLGVPLIPMALNSGLYWPTGGKSKRSGTITVRFLAPIPPGLPRAEAMRRLEAELEAGSDALCQID